MHNVCDRETEREIEREITLESGRVRGVVEAAAQIRDGSHHGLEQVALVHHPVRVTRGHAV